MGEAVVIRINAKTDNFESSIDKIDSKLKTLDSNLLNIAKVSSAAFVGLTGIMTASALSFSKFENEITGVKTLLDQTSFGAKDLETGFSEMKKGILGVGSSAPVAIGSLNKALFDTVSAGVSAGKAVESVNVSARLAVAGQTSIAIATHGITSALNAYSIEVSKAEEIAAKFFTAQKRGSTNVEELSSGFGQVAAAASGMGVSFDELLASVTASTLGGIKTSQAYTGLGAVLSGISSPTEKATKEAQKLGIEFSSTALRSLGLKGFLDQITSSAGYTETTLENLFGSIEAKKIVMTLAGSQAKTFSDVLKELGNTQQITSTLTRAYTDQSATLSSQTTLLKNKIFELAVGFGEKLAPTIKLAVGAFAGVVDFFNSHPIAAALAGKLIVVGAAISGITLAVVAASKVLTLLGGAMVTLNLGVLTLATSIRILVGATGIGLLLTFLPDVINFFKGISSAADHAGKSVSGLADEISKLEARKKELNDIDKSSGTTHRSEIDAIDLKIKKIKEMKEAQAQKDEKLGMLEIKKEAATSKTISGVDGKINKAPSIASDSGEKAIQSKKEELEKLRIMGETSSQKKLELLRREQEIEQGFRDARIIKDKEERELTLQSLKTQNEELLKQKKSFFESEIEAKKELDIQLATLDREARESLTIEQIDSLIAAIQTKKEIENQATFEKLENNIREKNILLEDERKYGESLARAKRFFSTNELSMAKETFTNLTALMRTKSKELFAIGKLASLAQAGVNIAEGVTKALAQGGGIFGPLLAASVMAAGAIQITTISGAKMGFNKGGIAKGGIIGKDSIPALLQDSEIVAPPQNFEEVIGSVRAKREADKIKDERVQEQQNVKVVFDLDISKNASELITIRQRESLALGIV